ncbi:hypothetical protein BGZ83_004607 [Gryganskiella cystojenkinii]|nr:hypothetical protein BGZ83_004607 [Gryganskiella cystojenkinii]
MAYASKRIRSLAMKAQGLEEATAKELGALDGIFQALPSIKHDISNISQNEDEDHQELNGATPTPTPPTLTLTSDSETSGNPSCSNVKVLSPHSRDASQVHDPLDVSDGPGARIRTYQSDTGETIRIRPGERNADFLDLDYDGFDLVSRLKMKDIGQKGNIDHLMSTGEYCLSTCICIPLGLNTAKELLNEFMDPSLFNKSDLENFRKGVGILRGILITEAEKMSTRLLQ